MAQDQCRSSSSGGPVDPPHRGEGDGGTVVPGQQAGICADQHEAHELQATQRQWRCLIGPKSGPQWRVNIRADLGFGIGTGAITTWSHGSAVSRCRTSRRARTALTMTSARWLPMHRCAAAEGDEKVAVLLVLGSFRCEPVGIEAIGLGPSRPMAVQDQARRAHTRAGRDLPTAGPDRRGCGRGDH